MSLIKSISGIRGTIGGRPGEGLTPVDIVKFASAYGTWLSRRHRGKKLMVVIGRDARRSGRVVSSLVSNTLKSLGIDVTDIGMASTPTVEIAVTGTGADGGIIITASHNPAEWNALKLLNEKGEFLSGADGKELLAIAGSEDFLYAPLDELGSYVHDDSWGSIHIEQVLALELVDREAVSKADFTVAIDCVNSVGGIIVPALLKSLGVKRIVELNTTPDGHFAHNPEPLPANLTEISALTASSGADVGFVVDPDVDRLAIICEDGSMFGEEYTLVAVSDYVLSATPGNTVSNLSSTRALKDVTEKHGGQYFTAAVGEINVVEEMKERGAVIGGEGNGGVIYPELHYGRDAIAGIALFLSHLARSGMSCSELRKTYPDYFMAKKRLDLPEGVNFTRILDSVREDFAGHDIDERDGMRIEYANGWVQIRKSNTEPIMRIYAEGPTIEDAENLADRVIGIVKKVK
ncbi:MAG TPA: phosphoglucosamine mutase [Bacteroidales bacterium]|jgi:phosphomannomutase|nr:phosphoglucosamine mutase [Bacteroidales bacterium]MDI9553755.1 phosphoglucosamine mutase [Bacteroidota bacterium]HNY52967.1 phosphoglucosamine mutase [Bacteroidales bacterium]HOG57006.1 phosphoglucosamine mutase [Bacteroidales bacterium]HPB13459.1 phosphoglucosamine mutase [Bacteroidales bacterium]